MSLGYFIDKCLQPASENVYEALGSAAQYWKDMEAYVADHGPMTEEWRIYTKKAGWCKKLLLKQNSEERNILFAYPQSGYFTCVFVLGEKATAFALESDIPETVKTSISEAKTYREGRSILFEVKSENDLVVLKKLIDIKIDH